MFSKVNNAVNLSLRQLLRSSPASPQTNGSFGCDYSSPTPSRSTFLTIASRLCSTGVTSYCPTLVSLTPPQYSLIIPELRPKEDRVREGGARNLGVHLEGPYFCRKKKGAHKETVRGEGGRTKDAAKIMTSTRLKLYS